MSKPHWMSSVWLPVNGSEFWQRKGSQWRWWVPGSSSSHAGLKLCLLKLTGQQAGDCVGWLDLAVINFKLLHRLLVTRQRLHHLTPAAAPTCSHCGDQVVEDLEHALVNCSYNDGTGQLLLRTVQIHNPQVTASALLRLELNLQESLELPLTTFISTVLLTVWEKRLSRSRITVFDIRTTLEARCTILRKTRFRSQASLLSDIINTM